MTNQQAANVLKNFCNQIHTGRGSTKSGLEFNIIESLVKAINLLEQTPDTLTQQPFKFKIGDKVMSTINPQYGIGIITDVDKIKENYYYDVDFQSRTVLGFEEKHLVSVNN